MGDESSLLTIGEVARRAGLRTSAIRYYEAAGLVPPPLRSSGQRRYDTSILRRLAFVRVVQQAGLTIRAIRELLAGVAQGGAPSTYWRALAERKLPEVRALIRRAQEMERWLQEGLRCGCLDLDSCRLLEEVPAAAPRERPTGPRSAGSRASRQRPGEPG